MKSTRKRLNVIVSAFETTKLQQGSNMLTKAI